jgi:hypothetical protein
VSGTLTPPRERLDRGEGTGLGRPWLVIVLNDDHNTFHGVASALSSIVPGVSYDGGMRLAERIDRSDRRWSGRASASRRSSTGNSYESVG